MWFLLDSSFFDFLLIRGNVVLCAGVLAKVVLSFVMRMEMQSVYLRGEKNRLSIDVGNYDISGGVCSSANVFAPLFTLLQVAGCVCTVCERLLLRLIKFCAQCFEWYRMY